MSNKIGPDNKSGPIYVYLFGEVILRLINSSPLLNASKISCSSFFACSLAGFSGSI